MSHSSDNHLPPTDNGSNATLSNERGSSEALSNATWTRSLASDCVEKQADALRRIAGSEAAAGIAARVVELSGSNDDDVRMWAAEALETSVQASTEELSDLTRLLTDSDDSEVRYWSATLIGRLGPAADSAAEALLQCLGNCDYLPAKERAVWALGQLGPAAKLATAALKNSAANGPPRLSRMATQVLQSLEAGETFERPQSHSSRNSSEAAA